MQWVYQVLLIVQCADEKAYVLRMVIPRLGSPSESEGESEEVIDASSFRPRIVSEGASQVRGSLPSEEAIDTTGDLSVERRKRG